MTSPAWTPARAAGPSALLDQEPALGLDLFALILGERAHRHAELARRGLGRAPRLSDLLGRRFASDALSCLVSPCARILSFTSVPGRDSPMMRGRSIDFSMSRPVDREDDVAGLDPGLLRGTLGLDRRDQPCGLVFKPKTRTSSWLTPWMVTPSSPRVTLAVFCRSVEAKSPAEKAGIKTGDIISRSTARHREIDRPAAHSSANRAPDRGEAQDLAQGDHSS